MPEELTYELKKLLALARRLNLNATKKSGYNNWINRMSNRSGISADILKRAAASKPSSETFLEIASSEQLTNALKNKLLSGSGQRYIQGYSALTNPTRTTTKVQHNVLHEGTICGDVACSVNNNKFVTTQGGGIKWMALRSPAVGTNINFRNYQSGATGEPIYNYHEVIMEDPNDFSEAAQFMKGGSKIHIKEKNRGAFTEYCHGKVTEECIARGKRSKNPLTRKRATFAANARRWKHQEGGTINYMNIYGETI